MAQWQQTKPCHNPTQKSITSKNNYVGATLTNETPLANNLGHGLAHYDPINLLGSTLTLWFFTQPANQIIPKIFFLTGQYMTRQIVSKPDCLTNMAWFRNNSASDSINLAPLIICNHNTLWTWSIKTPLVTKIQRRKRSGISKRRNPPPPSTPPHPTPPQNSKLTPPPPTPTPTPDTHNTYKSIHKS